MDPVMPLALFDLDNTLIAGDSDYSWGEFLTTKKIVDSAYFKSKNDQFYRDYQAGKLDILAYLTFSLAPLSGLARSELDTLHKEFMQKIIEPMWLPKAEELLTTHRDKEDTLMVVTSTNRFIVAPICKKLGIEHLIATELEESDNKFTGQVSGIPSFQEGKVKRLNNWLNTSNLSLEGSSFYSDSINDLPLLEIVSHPVAVDPCPKLKEEATRRGWKTISLRD
ncbi:MAG: HAD superfamily hydrolase (TIGR01490 family) [Porticoccus sp.]|jgi:HAD superfamily hydrolase (TIGR01490 family)